MATNNGSAKIPLLAPGDEIASSGESPGSNSTTAAALRASEEKYRAIMENASDALVITDLQGSIVEVNRKAEELFGYTREELTKMQYTQLHPAEKQQQTRAAYNEIVGNKIRYVKNVGVRRKDGTVFPADITGGMIEYGGKQVVQGSFRDVSDRQRAEEELTAAKENLERLVQERTAELMIKNKQLEAEIEERKGYEERLQNKRQDLELKSSQLAQLNSALQVLLKQREEDKRELEDKVLLNIKKLVLPHVENLQKSKLDRKTLSNLNIIEANLNNILSPFTQKLSAKFLGFTHKEIQIANMVKEGKDTKEIANFLHVSVSAVKLHRYHIRRKLGLIAQKVNLRSYLSSLSQE
jgi:PAS domain S-box-containing protein